MLINIKNPIKQYYESCSEIDKTKYPNKKSDLLVINQPSQDNKANNQLIFCYNPTDNYYL